VKDPTTKLLSLPGILRWEAMSAGTEQLADMLTSAAERIEALELEAQRLVQELNRASLDLASERAQRIDAEHERNRFRDRLAEGRAN
jgi:predicted transcriptional regulator